MTLFGIAARNAILLVSHTEHLIAAEGHDWTLDTVILATRERTTPILMTALVTALGLLPLALQTGQAGREIQGPMAIVILGGLITSTDHEPVRRPGAGLALPAACGERGR